MARMAISVCDNADEQAKAIGYWKDEGYELAMDEVREINRLSVFEEDGGQQQQWSKRYDNTKGVRVLIFVKK
ncbi:MAG: hypothetical protein ACK4X1_06425 [Terricaulis sp.]